MTERVPDDFGHGGAPGRLNATDQYKLTFVMAVLIIQNRYGARPGEPSRDEIRAAMAEAEEIVKEAAGQAPGPGEAEQERGVPSPRPLWPLAPPALPFPRFFEDD
jgi:hypothetical protein